MTYLVVLIFLSSLWNCQKCLNNYEWYQCKHLFKRSNCISLSFSAIVQWIHFISKLIFLRLVLNRFNLKHYIALLFQKFFYFFPNCVVWNIQPIVLNEWIVRVHPLPPSSNWRGWSSRDDGSIPISRQCVTISHTQVVHVWITH